jgi:Stress responsive A/B Barrel Domain
MVHRIVLYKLKPNISVAQLEVIMMQTRIQLLKVSVAANVRCGRRIDNSTEWQFFFSVDFDSKERLRIFEEDPFYIKFVEEVIKPNMGESLVLDFDGDPRPK